jgi:transposase-like protein
MGIDLLREAVRVVSQEVSELVGAAKHERSEGRRGYRNGYRDRIWQTREGEVQLRIPELRHGSYFPSLLAPRRRSE